jgi:hypothetical protein
MLGRPINGRIRLHVRGPNVKTLQMHIQFENNRENAAAKNAIPGETQLIPTGPRIVFVISFVRILFLLVKICRQIVVGC